MYLNRLTQVQRREALRVASNYRKDSEPLVIVMRELFMLLSGGIYLRKKEGNKEAVLC